MNEQHDRSITTAIQRIAGTFSDKPPTLTTGEVLSVDISKRSCVVMVDNDVELTCLLMAQIGDGIILTPSIGSTVGVLYSVYNSAYVISYSDLDTIGLKGTEFGGLVKVIELTQKLNALEDKVNSIITTFNSHVHNGVTTGVGTSAVTPTTITGTLTPTQQKEIENKNVTHGD